MNSIEMTNSGRSVSHMFNIFGLISMDDLIERSHRDAKKNSKVFADMLVKMGMVFRWYDV